MKKLLLFLFPLLIPFLVSAGPADLLASSPESFSAAVREQMLSGRRLFSVVAEYPVGGTLTPAAVMDAVYRFDDEDPGNDLDDLRETVAFQSVRVSGNRCSFLFYYLASPSEEAFVEREAGQVLTLLSLKGKGEAERAQAIVDWICDNVSYDAGTRTAYAALKDGASNCVGYSVLAFKLLRGAGLDAKIVNGMGSNGVQHAWNLVKINGEWYNLDVTWGDTGMTDRWFFRGTDGFSEHARFAVYCTDRFNRLCPMAREDLNCTPLSLRGS